MTYRELASIVLIAVSLIIAVFVFKAAPTWIVEGIGRIGWLGAIGAAKGGFGALVVKNIVEAVIRLTIFVVYIVFVARLKEIRRVFEYHGAEHTVINAHESDQTNHKLDFIAGFDTLHPRCGTSFIVIMIVLMLVIMSLFDAMLVLAFYPGLSWPPLWVRLVSRIAVIPLLSGVSYEIIKNAYKHRNIRFVDWFLSFGMSFQRLTTRKPSRDELECGLASLMRVREVEEGLALAGTTFESEIRLMGEPAIKEEKIEAVE